jgi:MHS family proline/betaine transporter-like MFS transporter
MTTWKRRFGVALAHIFEYYDIAIYSALALYIGVNFFPKEIFGQNSELFVWCMFGLRLLSRPFGGITVGVYADRFGRKQALILTSTITGIATLIMALLPTYHQIGLLASVLFFIMQLLQAFSFGGESPAAVTYLMEEAHDREKARIGAVLWGSSFLSIVLSFSIIFILKHTFSYEEMIDFGWRIPLFFGLVNIICSFYFKMKLLDSDNYTASKSIGIQKIPAFKIFIIMIPTIVLVYANTFSSAILAKQFSEDPMVREVLPIAFNVIFFVLCWVVAFLVDRYSDCTKILNRAYVAMLFLSIPVYWLQEFKTIPALVVSQCLISILIATITTITPAVVFDQVSDNKKNRITSIALGLNLSVSIFGAFSPLAIHLLKPYGPVYIGGLMSICGLIYFLGMFFGSLMQRRHQVILLT